MFSKIKTVLVFIKVLTCFLLFSPFILVLICILWFVLFVQGKSEVVLCKKKLEDFTQRWVIAEDG